MNKDTIEPDFGAKVTKELNEDFGISTDTFPEWAKSNRRKLIAAVSKSVVDQAKKCYEARVERDDEIRELQNPIYLEPPDRRSPLGDGGANICSSVTFEQRQTLHAFFMSVLASRRPYIRVVAKPGASQAAASKIQQFYDELYASLGYWDVLDAVVLNMLDHGTGFIMPTWKRRIAKVRRMLPIGPDTAMNAGFRPVEVEDIETGEMTRLGTYKSDDGRVVQEGAMETVVTDKVISDCPCFLSIRHFDYFQYPATGRCPDSVWMNGYRFNCTLADLRAGVNAGEYDQEMYDILIDSNPTEIGELNRSNLESFGGEDDPTVRDTQLQKANTGKAARVVEMVSVTVRIDGDGDGEYEDWHMVIETSTCVPLRITRSRYDPTFRPIRPAVVFRKTDQIYGVPLPKILEDIQKESDAAHNLALDTPALANTFIVAESRAQRTSLVREEIAVGLNHVDVEDDSSKAFSVQRLGSGDNVTLPSIDMIAGMAARVTAANESIVGVVDTTGSTTATEAKAAMANGAKRLTVMVTRLVKPLLEAHHLVHSMMLEWAAQNHDGNPETLLESPTVNGLSYGTDMTLEEFMTPVSFELASDPTTEDKALRLQAAEKVLLMGERSPFMQDLRRQWEMTRHFLTEYGVRNYQDFIGTLADVEEMIQSQEQEGNQPKPVEFPPNINENYLAIYLAKYPQELPRIVQALALINKSAAEQYTEPGESTETIEGASGAVEAQDAAMAEQQQTEGMDQMGGVGEGRF